MSNIFTNVPDEQVIILARKGSQNALNVLYLRCLKYGKIAQYIVESEIKKKYHDDVTFYQALDYCFNASISYYIGGEKRYKHFFINLMRNDYKTKLKKSQEKLIFGLDDEINKSGQTYNDILFDEDYVNPNEFLIKNYDLGVLRNKSEKMYKNATDRRIIFARQEGLALREISELTRTSMKHVRNVLEKANIKKGEK